MADYEGTVWDQGGAVFNVLASYSGQPGADPTGSTDSTAAIQRALDAGAGGVVVLPKGLYLADGLQMSDGTTVVGNSATIRGRASTSDPLLTAGNRCRIIGLGLDGDKTNRPAAGEGEGIGVTAPQVNEAQIVNCTVKNCARAGVQISNSSDFLVSGCKVTACGMFGVIMAYAHRGRVTDNYVSDCVNNIQWWGGDAAQSTTIGVTHLTISGNISLNAVSGIWGSLGSSITVAGNTVEGMSDVGIDFEGCQNCAASGNAAKNCVTGAITLFNGSAHISITGNTVRQEVEFGVGFYLHGSGTHKYIVFAGNSVWCSGSMAISSDLAVAENLSIQGNGLICESDDIMIRLLEINNVILSGNQAHGAGGVGFSIEGIAQRLVCKSDPVLGLRVSQAALA